MDETERAEFRAFCNAATDSQLGHIVAKEREAARGGNAYREACAAIAEAVAEGRGVL